MIGEFGVLRLGAVGRDVLACGMAISQCSHGVVAADRHQFRLFTGGGDLDEG